jgi:hypothetical protein
LLVHELQGCIVFYFVRDIHEVFYLSGMELEGLPKENDKLARQKVNISFVMLFLHKVHKMGVSYSFIHVCINFEATEWSYKFDNVCTKIYMKNVHISRKRCFACFMILDMTAWLPAYTNC